MKTRPLKIVIMWALVGLVFGSCNGFAIISMAAYDYGYNWGDQELCKADTEAGFIFGKINAEWEYKEEIAWTINAYKIERDFYKSLAEAMSGVAWRND